MTKTNLPSGSTAFFNTEQLDEEKKPVERRRWNANETNKLTGVVNEWTKREVDVRTGPHTSFIRVYLEVQDSRARLGGSAWFNNVRLERVDEKKVSYVFNGKGPGENLLTNSCFERASKHNPRFSDGWEQSDVRDGGYARLDQREKMSGSKSIQVCPVSFNSYGIQ